MSSGTSVLDCVHFLCKRLPSLVCCALRASLSRANHHYACSGTQPPATVCDGIRPVIATACRTRQCVVACKCVSSTSPIQQFIPGATAAGHLLAWFAGGM